MSPSLGDILADLNWICESVPVRRQGWVFVPQKAYDRYAGYFGSFTGRHRFALCKGIQLLPEGYRITEPPR